MNNLNLNTSNNLININKKTPKFEAKSKVNTGLKKSSDSTSKSLTENQNEYVIKESNSTTVKTLGTILQFFLLI